VDYNHPDLKPNMWVNPLDGTHGHNALTGANNPMDDHGHGTHCAGIIAAAGNNGIGVAGVCWNAQIMALKFIGPDGSGYTSGALACIEFAVLNGAKVLNFSWGGDDDDPPLKEMIDAVAAAGVFIAAAAGNDASNTDLVPHYPSSFDCPNLVSVMSTTANDVRASSSNYGVATVHLGAPGSGIISCYRNGAYASMGGTSMAAPHAAGAAALLLSVNPALKPENIKTILMETADPVLPGLCASGGRLNLARAMDRVWLSLGKAVNAPELAWDTGGDATWFEQDVVTHDGLHAAQSGAIGDKQSSWIETTVTGPGTLSFWWKVSSELDDEPFGDWLAVSTNNVPVVKIGGEVDWSQVSLEILEGATVVRWTYSKDKAYAEGSDCGWLDEVDWRPVFEVVFDANGGEPETQILPQQRGKSYALPQTPSCAGWLFKGWFTESAGGNRITLATTVTAYSGHTLYAQWEAEPVLAGDRYVNENQPDDSGDGRSWPTAKKTIQAAVVEAVDGESIIVWDGVYEAISTDNKSIHIQSVNGAEWTIIDGGGTNRCATLGEVSTLTNTVLTGFILQNGNTARDIGRKYQGGGSFGGMLNHCIVRGNKANEGGGSYGGTLNHCMVSNNTANIQGGGTTSSTLNHCIVSDNTANIQGGGTFRGTLNHCLIKGNTANYGGGASFGMLNYCIVLENTANDNGGGTVDSTLNNCVILKNTAIYGGGAFNSILNNCTLSYNTAFYGGGTCDCWVNNNIVWNNTSDDGQSNNYGGDCFFSHSCTFPMPTGSADKGGNISDDPLFLPDGSFRLQPYSPCIDKGNNSYVTWDFDLEGNPRILDGVVDMGAYETSWGFAMDTPELQWRTGGDALWFMQSAVTREKPCAAQSGAIGNSQSSWIETTVSGPGTLSFWWKVSSEWDEPGGDWLVLSTNGVNVARISGEAGWAQIMLEITGDKTHVCWTYIKDKAFFEGSDCGWLEGVVWTPKVEPGDPMTDYEAWLALHELPDSPAHYDAWIAHPCDPGGVFYARIEMDGETPVITWHPDHWPYRKYTIVAKEKLTDETWLKYPWHINESARFFKVRVGLW